MKTMSKAAALATLTLAAGNALAVNTFWTGNAGDSRWNNANNWSPAHIPNNTDAVYIGSNGPVIVFQGDTATAKSVSCTIQLNIIGGLYVNGTATLLGQTLMYGTNPIFLSNGIEVSGQLDIYSGTIGHYTTAATTHIAPGAIMTVKTSASATIQTHLTVDGRLDVNDATLSVLGDANYPIGMVAGAGGTISINGNSTVHGNAYSYLASDGTVVLTGAGKAPSIASDMKFFNGSNAVLRVDGGTNATIGNPAQVAYPTGKIDSGYWWIKDNSSLSFPDGRAVSSIETNGRVILEGAASSFANLSQLNNISSVLSLRNGADLSVTPIGGYLVHQGSIDLSPGSLLSVQGALSFAPNSYTLSQMNSLTASQAGTIYSRDSAHLDGFFSAQFNDGFNPGAIQSLVMVQSGSSAVDGAFSTVAANNLSGHASMTYEPSTATLHLTCRADFNNDNAVDDADFVFFVYSYNILDCADPSMPFGCTADLNSDGVVEDADFSLFAAAYDALLCD